jgi:hypothetical protein
LSILSMIAIPITFDIMVLCWKQQYRLWKRQHKDDKK